MGRESLRREKKPHHHHHPLQQKVDAGLDESFCSSSPLYNTFAVLFASPHPGFGGMLYFLLSFEMIRFCHRQERKGKKEEEERKKKGEKMK